MDERHGQFVGLDVGATLTLASFWTEPARAGTGPAEAAWPVRAQMAGLRATAQPGADEISRIIGGLCARHEGQPAKCTLVRMGWTSAELAAEMSAGLGLRGVVAPQRRFVLWTEGVLPAREVKEYHRPMPPGDARDLERLRMTFAELMEQAAEEVQTLVLDQDDTVLDRYIDVRGAGAADTYTIPVESLTDPARLLGPFHTLNADTFTTEAQRTRRSTDQISSPCSPCLRGEDSAVEVLAARLRCIILT